MKINDFPDADGSRFQDLQTEDGVSLMRLGILLPGMHEFGPYPQKTMVRVVSGAIDVNGKSLDELGIELVEPNQQIVLRNVNYASYEMRFGGFITFNRYGL